jgi:hypothetical protein
MTTSTLTLPVSDEQDLASWPRSRSWPAMRPRNPAGLCHPASAVVRLVREAPPRTTGGRPPPARGAVRPRSRSQRSRCGHGRTEAGRALPLLRRGTAPRTLPGRPRQPAEGLRGVHPARTRPGRVETGGHRCQTVFDTRAVKHLGRAPAQRVTEAQVWTRIGRVRGETCAMRSSPNEMDDPVFPVQTAFRSIRWDGPLPPSTGPKPSASASSATLAWGGNLPLTR